MDSSAHFSRIFAAAHRVWNDPGKCHNIHGHNYEVEVRIDGWNVELTPQGFLVPFDAIKGVVDYFDHSLILDAADELTGALSVLAADDPGGVFATLCVRLVDGPPSTEILARHLAVKLADAVEMANPGLAVFSVRVQLRETAGIQASFVEHRSQATF